LAADCVGAYFTDLKLPCYLWQINQSGLVRIHRIVSDVYVYRFILYFLTFMGPCIVTYFYSKTN